MLSVEFWLWLSDWEEVFDDTVSSWRVCSTARVQSDFLSPVRAFRITCFIHCLYSMTWSVWRHILLLEKLVWDWRFRRDPSLGNLRGSLLYFHFWYVSWISRFFRNSLWAFFWSFHYYWLKHLDIRIRLLNGCLFWTLCRSLLFKNLIHCLMLLHPFFLVLLILVLLLYCLLWVVNLAGLVSFFKELLLLIYFFFIVLITC